MATTGFMEMTSGEMMEVDGGGVVAAVYALGFIMGMSPMGAVIVCGAAIAAGVTAGILVNAYAK